MIKINRIKSSNLIKCPVQLSGWGGGNSRAQRENFIKNKKALSNIIASLILILLSLVAVSMLWVTFNNLSTKIQMSPEINCFDIKIQPPIKINSACFNSEKNQIEIELKRNLEELQINSLGLITETGEWKCSSSCGNCVILNEGETKTYFLEAETKPKEIIFKINECVVETESVGDC